MAARDFSRAALAACAAAALLCVLVWFWPRVLPDGPAALQAFEAADPAENGIDPLVLAGESVVPLVIDRIADRDMPRRSDAIRFLAEGAYREAIPALDRILHDDAEKGFMRCEALLAVSRIDPTLGINRAVRLKSRLDDLGFCTKQVLAGILPEGRRTYPQARWASLTRW